MALPSDLVLGYMLWEAVSERLFQGFMTLAGYYKWHLPGLQPLDIHMLHSRKHFRSKCQ